MAIVDIVLIAVVGIFALVGLSRGFLKSFINMFGGLASLAVSILLAKPAAQLLSQVYNFTGWFSSLIGGGISPSIPDTIWSGGAVTGQQVLDGLTSISAFFKGALARFIDVTQTFATKSEFITSIGNSLGAIAMLIATAILLFILIRIAVGLLSKIFAASTRNHTIGAIDRFLGFILGLAKGALLVAIVFTLVYFLSGISFVATTVAPIIEGSTVTKFLYTYFQQFMASIFTVENISAVLAQLFGGGA